MSSGPGGWLAGPTRSKPPASYFLTWDAWSRPISTLMFLRAPVAPPHQLATGWKAIEAFGVRSVILKGPAPTAVSGLPHQLSSPPCVMAFSLTTAAVQSASSLIQ